MFKTAGIGECQGERGKEKMAFYLLVLQSITLRSGSSSSSLYLWYFLSPSAVDGYAS